MSLINVKPIQPADLNQVLSLHLKTLGYTFNSRLGEAHLRTLYLTVMNDPGSFVGVAFDGVTLVGLVSGTMDAKRLEASLYAALPPARWVTIGLRVFFHPMLLLECRKARRLNAGVYLNGRPIKGMLTTVAVAESHRKKGVGRMLVGELERFFRGRGCLIFSLDTLSNNREAIEFYRNLGFKFVENRFDSSVFVKEITGSTNE